MCFVFLGRALSSFMLFLLVVGLPVSALAGADDIVAQVGSISITKYELGREFQRVLPTAGSYHGGVSKEKVREVREQALEKCIERALKVMYAIEHEIVADTASVKEQYEKVRGNFGSEEAFEKALGGESPEAFRGSLFRAKLALAAEKAAVDSKVVVNDEEMRKFYDKNQDKFMQPTQYKASHILIKVDPASIKEQREERLRFARELLKKAQAGEDFYNLAYYNSDGRTKFVGGDLGYFGAGQTVAEFDAVVQKMKVGEISDIVESMYGYHIIKLMDIKPAARMSFDDVRTTLLPQMKKAHRDKLYEDWITSLRGEYSVMIADVEQ